MYTIYNLAIHVGSVLLLPYLLLRVLGEKKHRTGLRQRLGFTPRRIAEGRTGKPVIWVHSVSVGEVLAASPLVAETRRNFPGYQLLLSTTTVTGQGVCLKRLAAGDDLVIYFPLDIPFIVRRVLAAFSPRLVILMETEIWPNLIRGARRRGVKLLLVNGRLSDKSFGRYRRFRPFVRRLLRSFSFIGMQTEEGKKRMEQLGARGDALSVMGSMKYEAALSSAPSQDDVQHLRQALGIPERKVIVAGSTHRGEEHLILRAYMELREKHAGLTLVVAPRHPERFQEVENLLRQKGVSHQRRSQGAGCGYGGAVLLVDTLGELTAFYGLGSVAFVGKSLTRRGGHNPLEPAACGKPVVFGCQMDNFREVADFLVARGGAVQVSSFRGLVSALDCLLTDEAKAREMGRRARAAVESRTGGVSRALRAIQAALAP
jgi:3-deoxy-D-manno-octulosonic-acid transferase